MAKRGRTPSLITGSSGKPNIKVAGRKRDCKRCKKDIFKGETCIEVPKPGGFGKPKTYCISCFKEVLYKTQEDLDKLKLEFEEE